MSLVESINNAATIATAVVAAAPSIVGCASVLAALLPPPESNGFLGKVHEFINVLAFNVRHAANKEP